MKVPPNVFVPVADPIEMARQIRTVLELHARAINENARVEDTGPPTTKLHLQNEFVWNKTPTELGTAPNKYMILGWLCVASGTPGTWQPARVATGN